MNAFRGIFRGISVSQTCATNPENGINSSIDRPTKNPEPLESTGKMQKAAIPKDHGFGRGRRFRTFCEYPKPGYFTGLFAGRGIFRGIWERQKEGAV